MVRALKINIRFLRQREKKISYTHKVESVCEEKHDFTPWGGLKALQMRFPIYWGHIPRPQGVLETAENTSPTVLVFPMCQLLRDTFISKAWWETTVITNRSWKTRADYTKICIKISTVF